MGQEIRSCGCRLRADARFAVGSVTLDASFYSERNRIKRGREEYTASSIAHLLSWVTPFAVCGTTIVAAVCIMEKGVEHL
jgi:hypothetical protein